MNTSSNSPLKHPPISSPNSEQTIEMIHQLGPSIIPSPQHFADSNRILTQKLKAYQILQKVKANSTDSSRDIDDEEWQNLVMNLKTYFENHHITDNNAANQLDLIECQHVTPKTQDEVITDLFSPDKMIRFNDNLLFYASTLGNSTLFISSMIRIFSDNTFPFNIIWAEILFDYFIPFLKYSKHKETPESIRFKILIIELLTQITLRYPRRKRETPHSPAYFFNLMTDLLCICRHSTGSLLVHSFRCFAQLYKKVYKAVAEELIGKIIVDMLLTFTPNHPLFLNLCRLVQTNPKVYDDVKFLKLFIRMKVSHNIQTYQFIDSVLSAHEKIETPLIIIQFLVQMCIAEPIYTNAITQIIRKHSRIFVQSKSTHHWMKIFVRRSFQWIAITNKLGRYQHMRELTARVLSSFMDGLTDSISNEIKTDASTLLQSNVQYPEIACYFTPSSFDQVFLDEIDVIEVQSDLKEMLLSPKETFSHDQIMKLEYKRKQQSTSDDTESDPESFQVIDKNSETIDQIDFLRNTIACFYPFVFMLVTIVFLLIIS